MRTITRLTSAALTSAVLALGACASTGELTTAAAPSWFSASSAPFVGWARVTGEEFRLYENEVDLRAPSTDCVSGALPRNAQRAAGDLNGLKVRVYGRAAPWSERDTTVFNWQGSKIANGCRRDVVILADRIEVIR